MPRRPGCRGVFHVKVECTKVEGNSKEAASYGSREWSGWIPGPVTMGPEMLLLRLFWVLNKCRTWDSKKEVLRQ